MRLFPFHKWAEECLPELYALSRSASRRGISLGFNLGWMLLEGKDDAGARR